MNQHEVMAKRSQSDALAYEVEMFLAGTPIILEKTESPVIEEKKPFVAHILTPSKRVMDADKRKAREDVVEIEFNKLTHFIGKPCVCCGRKTRYISSKACVQCQIDRSNKSSKSKRIPERVKVRADAAEARKLAEMRGHIHYIGTPCKRCGECKKYTKWSSCVRCSIERRKEKSK